MSGVPIIVQYYNLFHLGFDRSRVQLSPNEAVDILKVVVRESMSMDLPDCLI